MKHYDNRRVLLVDDNESIHSDFRKILAPDRAGVGGLSGARAAFFGQSGEPKERPSGVEGFELHSARQGQDAYELVRKAVEEDVRFAVAFVDVRMPPGWDGVKTIERMWEVDPDLQTVLCTAYSDYSWEQTTARLGISDRLLILKKPFDAIEIQQLAEALTKKWNGERRERALIEDLRAAEQRARSYAASLETAGNHLMLAKAASDCAATRRNELLLEVGSEVGRHLDILARRLEVLAQDGETGELEAVLSTCEAATEVVRRVVDVTSLETGTLVSHESDLDPRDLLRSVISDVVGGPVDLSTASGRGSILVEVSDDVPTHLEVDGDRLRQALAELLRNAKDFSNTEPIEVSVSLRRGVHWRRSELCFEVRDPGPGLPSGNEAAAFEPFSRTEERGRDHSGLGLTLARDLARHLGGDLEYERLAPSDEHRSGGSCFRLTVPVGRGASARRSA